MKLRTNCSGSQLEEQELVQLEDLLILHGIWFPFHCTRWLFLLLSILSFHVDCWKTCCTRWVAVATESTDQSSAT